MIDEGGHKRLRLESETRVSTFDDNNDLCFEKQLTCPSTPSALLFLANRLVFSGLWDFGMEFDENWV